MSCNCLNRTTGKGPFLKWLGACIFLMHGLIVPQAFAQDDAEAQPQYGLDGIVVVAERTQNLLRESTTATNLLTIFLVPEFGETPFHLERYPNTWSRWQYESRQTFLRMSRVGADDGCYEIQYFEQVTLFWLSQVDGRWFKFAFRVKKQKIWRERRLTPAGLRYNIGKAFLDDSNATGLPSYQVSDANVQLQFSSFETYFTAIHAGNPQYQRLLFLPSFGDAKCGIFMPCGWPPCTRPGGSLL